MSLPQLACIVVLLTIAHVVDHALGEMGKVATFSGLGAIGLVATVLNERRGARFRDALVSLEPQERNEALMRLENSELLADVVLNLGIVPPRVPLRRPVESFACSDAQARTVRWALRIWLFLGGFLVAGFASDRLLGREVFFPLSQPWWEIVGLGLVCVAGTTMSWWLARGSRSVVRVSDAAMELDRPGQPTRRIAWDEVTAARMGGFSRRLRLTSGTETIVVLSDTIQDYGRLLNIALSRLPAGVRVRAG